jgi:3-phenylpropionate/trans-cinnamate dioxygenase ferredoxin subunit
MAFEKVASLADIPAGRGLKIEIHGIEVGLFRDGDDVYAMENACPHQGVPLSDGALDGCIVTCSAHGWEFDLRTGHRPEDPDGFPIPCFAVRVDDGEVWVDLDHPINRRGRSPARE